MQPARWIHRIIPTKLDFKALKNVPRPRFSAEIPGEIPAEIKLDFNFELSQSSLGYFSLK